MSTKRISRSILEGGRYNADERRESTRRERARTRTWLTNVKYNNVDCDDSDPEPRIYVYKEGRHDFSLARRWLESNIGKPWDDVYRRMTVVFGDARTGYARWYTIKYNIMMDVDGAGSHFDGVHRWRQRYFIDDDGILRANPRKPYLRLGTAKRVKDALAVIGDRAVNDYGAVQFWAEKVDSSTVSAPNGWSYFRPIRDVFRQTIRFTEDESIWWNSLSKYTKEQIELWRGRGVPRLYY